MGKRKGGESGKAGGLIMRGGHQLQDEYRIPYNEVTRYIILYTQICTYVRWR